MSTTTHRLALTWGLLLTPTGVAAQTAVDSALATYIGRIRAIDNHAHPMLPVAPGAPADTEFDALPLDAIPPFAIPWRLTLEAPVWSAASSTIRRCAAPPSY
jgi:hypothetical protein